MKQAVREFIVPGYYSCFVCKGGSCRNTCCNLSKTVSLEEYRNLVGLSCPEDIRRDLDASLTLHKNADPYKYADMNLNFYGKCYMLDADGLCRLQSACGENVLPALCRYYPRAVRFGALPVCCCGNGCERTLELLADPTVSDVFDRKSLSFELPYEIPADLPEGLYQTRISLLCAEVMNVSTQLICRKLDLIRQLATDHKPDDSHTGSRILNNNRIQMDELRTILDYTGKQSDVLAAFTDAALHLDDDHYLDLERFEQAMRIQKAFPSFDRFLSRVLSNDILFRGFPFGESEIAPGQSFRIFQRIVYSLLMLVEANLERLSSAGMNGLIDLFVNYFRLVELTDYDANIHALIGDGVNGNDNGTDNTAA